MALAVSDLKVQLNMTADAVLDGIDTVKLPRLLAAATAHVERLLGFKLEAKFPPTTDDPPKSTVPADLELAILLLAADWYENTEASLVGVGVTTIPFGVQEIVNEYRNYTFGLSCEADDAE